MSIMPIQNSPNAIHSGSGTMSSPEVLLQDCRCVGMAMTTETCSDDASPHSISSETSDAAGITSFLHGSVDEDGAGGGRGLGK